MNIPFLDLKPVNAPFENELKKAACDVIISGRYINGEYVIKLEKEIASICQTNYAIAVSNGLDALKLIIRAYKEIGFFNEGDEVIMSANTYIATTLAVSDEGLKPVFVDMSPITLNLDTSLIEKAITLRTKAIMPVHLYGTPCWDNNIKDIAYKYGLKVIEDNAQAIGASTNIEGIHGSNATGGLGDAAGTSFYPTKNLGALGDAGMITTNDSHVADCVRALANYGCDYRYHNIYKGFNCRMDEIQAAMLLVKVKHLHAENIRRRSIADIYNQYISNNNIVKPSILNDTYQVWHQYPLRVKNREKFIKYMNNMGIGTDIMYPVPVYMQPCYSCDEKKFSCTESENFAKEVVCLPIGAHITNENAEYISKAANDFSI